MDIGQMFSPMPAMGQVNGTEPLSASATPGLPANNVFAGLMQGTAAGQPTAKTAKAGSEMQVVFNGEILKSTDQELLAALFTQGKPETSGKVTATAKKEEATEEPSQTKGLMPQDVALLLAGTMNIQPLQNGRMPESQMNDVGQKIEPQSKVLAGNDLPLIVADNLGSSKVSGKDAVTEEISVVGVKTAVISLATLSTAMTGKQADAASIPAAVQEVVKPAGEIKSSQGGLTGQKQVAVESGLTQPNMQLLALAGGTRNDISDSQGVTVDVNGGNRNVGEEITEKQQMVKASPSVATPITNVQSSITAVATPNHLPETTSLLSDLTGKTTPGSDQVPLQQTELRLVHSSSVTHPQAAVVMEQMNKNDSAEEGKIKFDPASNTKNLEGAATSLHKISASFAAETELMGQGKNETADPELNDQVALPNALDHSKTNVKQFENSLVSAQKEPNRPDLSENVVHQVKDLLVTREIKPGNEQMTLKLSPEHLGDLTLNFKMENQQLKVQIIAENQTVKDALMQNSENLKESLSRQNIKMESFEVLTNSGQRGFEQNDRGWKQLAQQQFTPGTQAYGSRYAVSEVNTDALPTYGRSQQYAMVDVHF